MFDNFSFLSVIILLPFVGMLFVLMSQNDEKNTGRNAFNVAMLAVLANLLLVTRVFYNLDLKKNGLQLIERFNWLETPNIDIVLGADIFSLTVIMAIHISFLIAMYSIRHNNHQKSMLVFALQFLGIITGFFLAADIFSFCICFEAMLFPLFMLIGMFGDIRRSGLIYRFFMYNFLGALILFLALILLFNQQQGFVDISNFSKLPQKNSVELFTLGTIFIAFLSRIPIWPFHYWISSINANIRNPLVFILVILLPLTGIYGFMRFLPEHIQPPILFWASALEIIAVITMIFIALIGLINKDIQYKLFSFVTVYFIMYLLALLNSNSMTAVNIAFSVFAYLIIIAVLECLANYMHFQQEDKGISPDGSLCTVPRLSFIYSFFILAALGLPISALFVNNFMLIANIVKYNMNMGLIVMFSLTLTSASLLKDLYRLKDRSRVNQDKPCIVDISKKTYVFSLIIAAILLFSSIRPLWFLGS